MNSFGRDSANAMWHWFFHRNPELAAKLVSGNIGARLGQFLARIRETGAVEEEPFRHYVEAFDDPGRGHAVPGGHCVPEETPEAVVDAVDTFRT